MPDSATILLVDDEDAVQKLLAFPLERDGFRVVQARDGEEALALFAQEHVDLVVLDVMLPKLDGLEVCKRLRAASSVPIIMLTARDDELDKVLGLELGADDYITKPFSIREFRSRVRALLRRASAPRHDPRGAGPIETDGLRIDLDRRQVEAHGRDIPLTYVEFELLRSLAAQPGRVFTRQMLLESLWGDSAYREPRTIDVHVRHLREKLERDPDRLRSGCALARAPACRQPPQPAPDRRVEPEARCPPGGLRLAGLGRPDVAPSGRPRALVRVSEPDPARSQPAGGFGVSLDGVQRRSDCRALRQDVGARARNRRTRGTALRGGGGAGHRDRALPPAQLAARGFARRRRLREAEHSDRGIGRLRRCASGR